jgi:hypothetical protein
VESIGLDQNALKIQLTEEGFEHRPLVVLAGGVAGLADRHTQGCRIQRHLGNECRTPTGGGLDRASQRLAVTDELLEIGCTTWDLCDRPVADGSAESRHVHLVEEVAEGRIGGGTLEFDPQRFGQHAVVADGKTFQIPQALATAQDPEHRHQQQIPGRDADPTPHPSIRNRLEEADQVEIGCSQCGFGQGEGAIPPTSTHEESRSQGACDTLSISPGSASPRTLLLTLNRSIPQPWLFLNPGCWFAAAGCSPLAPQAPRRIFNDPASD